MIALKQAKESFSKKLLCMLLTGFILSMAGSISVQAGQGNSGQPADMQQDRRLVTGVVLDQSGQPLIGVSVAVQGTTIGTMTDIDGKYSLEVASNQTLEFTYVGYKTVSLIANKDVLNITMEEDIQLMDEVVVIGYGTVKKSDLTGSVSSIKSDAIVRQPVTNATLALQGLAPGVMVSSNSGAPGGSISVRVRGIGTVNDSDPLYVVDGLPVSDINYLNPGDIASMEVLKDASATAIYGSRGANGVILVSTKQGKAGKTTVTFDGYYGFSKILNNLDLLTGSQWYDMQAQINQAKLDAGVDPKNIPDLSKVDRNTNTDWIDAVSRTAGMQNYNISIMGGMQDNYSYNLSLGYVDQEGTIKKTDFSRISIRQNIEKTVIKDIITVGTNFSYIQSNKHKILEGSNTVGILNSAIKLEPVIPVRDKDGKYGSSPFIDYNNPVADIDYTNNKEKESALVGNMYMNVNILKGISLKVSYGADIRKTDTYEFIPVYKVSNYQQNTINQVKRGYTKFNYYVWENTLSYNKTFAEKHNVNAVIGYTEEQGRTETLTGGKKNTPSDDPNMQYLDAAQEGATAQGTAWETSLRSFLGRVNYNFEDRYLVTASMRRDGSSKFGSERRYGNFPSFALGWRLSNEEFFKAFDLKWVSSIKLRGGWGRIGNQNIDNYSYQNLLSGKIQYSYLYGTNNNLNQGFVMVKLGNPNVKWETTESSNFGLDLNLFNSRLNFSGEYYIKKTKDMLLVEPRPLFHGFETGPTTNVGSAQNKGFEFNIEWRDKVHSVEYNVGFNITTISNKMTSLGSGLPMAGGVVRNGNATITRKGDPIGAFYGYKTAGLIQTAEQLVDVKKRQPNAQLGDVIFVDMNGDKILNDKDKTIIGNPIPDFTFGINLGVAWKGFDLNMQIGGSYGNDIFNAMRYYTYDLSSVTNKDKATLNHWTPTNTNTNMPRIAAIDRNDNIRISDRYVEDGSYIRLRNVQIGYTLPHSITRKAFIEKVRIYLTGQNLLTGTSYSGLDPEIGQISSTNYLSRGVDIGTYPQAMTITGGINITF